MSFICVIKYFRNYMHCRNAAGLKKLKESFNMEIRNSLLFIIILFTQIIGITTGYRCYTCSYGLWSDGDRRECIENPESLGHGSRLTCNRTSYCVLQEQYDIPKKVLLSYFRSCSDTSWGDECSISGNQVICKYSCLGNFCNRMEVGQRYKTYLAEHPNLGHSWNKSSYMFMSYFSLFVCLLLTLTFVKQTVSRL